MSRYLFALALLAVCTLPCKAADSENVRVVTAVIEVNAAKEFVASHEDAVIMDVRTPVKYETCHITGAVNVSVQDDSFEYRVIELDPNKSYIVHCTKNPAEGRSSRALETLQSLGFKHLYSLEGGYVAWRNAELPLTAPSD